MKSVHATKIIAEVSHDHLIPFLRPQLKLSRLWGAIYWIVNALVLGYLVSYSILNDLSMDEFTKSMGLGFAIFILVLPIHEIIHAILYKLVGAPKVGFGADWRKLVFYATADQFIVGRKKFALVALAPFLLLNSTLLLLGYLWPNHTLLLGGALFLHTAGCFGDFALVSFMHLHRSRNIQTMDNMSERKTYFLDGTTPEPLNALQ